MLLFLEQSIKYNTEYSNSLYKTSFAVIKSTVTSSVPKCTIPEDLLLYSQLMDNLKALAIFTCSSYISKDICISISLLHGCMHMVDLRPKSCEFYVAN